MPWAETMAVHAAAEFVVTAVDFVLQAAHFFVAEGSDEVVEVLVCESEEHGSGE